MADWDDRDFLSADENGEPEPREAAPPPDEDWSSSSSSSLPVSWPLFVAAALALVAGLGLYWLFSERGVSVPPTSSAPSEEALAEVAPEPAQPSIEPGEPEVDLPQLSQSDAFVRELLAGLSRHPAMTSLLLSDELVRKIVTAIVNVAEGDYPARHFPYLAPDGPYEVVHRPPEVFVDPGSYHRYDVLVAGLESLDPAGVADLYQMTKPLALEAYRELGYLDQPFEATFAKAIDVLLRTPVVQGRIGLNADSVNYTYVERRLEALAPAQKQLLRMGPQNTQKVQDKLRELARAMKLPIDS